MNSAGVTPKSVAQKWQFGVEVSGFDSAHFLKADLPSVEFEEVAHAPAGSMFDQKAAGRAKFDDITLEKSVPQEQTETSLLTWIRQCITVTAGVGGVPSDYMRDVDLTVHDRLGAEIKRYRLFNAWVKSAKFGELEGGSSDNIVESLTLTFQYFDIV
jgi:phage tail-like protein